MENLLNVITNYTSDKTYKLSLKGDPKGPMWLVTAKDEQDAFKQLTKIYNLKPDEFEIVNGKGKQ